MLKFNHSNDPTMTATLNLSAADAAALEFFEINSSYVEGFGLTNLDRDDRLMFRKGKKVAQQIIDAARRASFTRTPYTDEQARFIAETYVLSSGDRDTVVTAFLVRFPNSGHSVGSISKKFARFRVLDRSCPGDTQWESDQQVETIAADYPEVFEV